MSYLENGSTLRSMFRLMPPQRHDADPDRSEVLKHIQENLRCDLARSIRAFNSMRNKKSQVLVYDMVHRQWRGCDWVPLEDGDKVSLLLKTINDLKRDVAYLKTLVNRHERVVGQLSEKKRPVKRVSEPEPEPEPEPEMEQQPIPEKEKAADPKEEIEKLNQWRRTMLSYLDEPDAVSSVPPQ